MSSYLITGAGRGLGLEIAKQLLELPTTQVSHVFCLSRSKPGEGLHNLLNQHKDRASHVSGAVDNQKSLKEAAAQVEAKLAGKGLDVLLNNAGISPSNEGGIQSTPNDTMIEAFNVNVVGVHSMIAKFLPLLQKGESKKIINISTTLGAISWIQKFQSLPNPAYKISKSALNMMTALYALELGEQGFTVLAVSPGWLKTDLGSQAADLEPHVGAREVVRITQEANSSVNGKFLNIHVPGWEEAYGQYDGKEITW